MEHESSNIPLSKQVFSIPNLIGYFRIILIPIIVWNYINAQTASDYYFVTLLVAVSGISDALDGLIARHFNMITPLGKALDPIADKLTQGALAICLITKYPFMIVLFILIFFPEIPPTVANTFILISILFMLYSLIRYAMVNIKKLCRHTERKGRP